MLNISTYYEETRTETCWKGEIKRLIFSKEIVNFGSRLMFSINNLYGEGSALFYPICTFFVDLNKLDKVLGDDSNWKEKASYCDKIVKEEAKRLVKDVAIFEKANYSFIGSVFMKEFANNCKNKIYNKGE